MAIELSFEDPAQPEIIALLEDGERFAASLYPPESNHQLPLAALRAPHVRFLVARDAAGRAVATAAIAVFGDWAELKRMWVAPEARGKGVAQAVLAALEAKAREEGARALMLETGIKNHAALAFYERAGFRRRGLFGDYQPDPISVFMEKGLS